MAVIGIDVGTSNSAAAVLRGAAGDDPERGRRDPRLELIALCGASDGAIVAGW